MTLFSKLLDYVDSVQIKPTLEKHIAPKVLELTGHTHEFVAVELDESISRGHVRPIIDGNSPKGFINQVRFSDRLNLCWMRFVCTKEVMHAFDSPEARTNSSAKLFELTEHLSMTPPDGRPPALIAEANAFWMALAVLCPKRLRDRYRPQYVESSMSAYEVALALRIPEVYVRHVMRDDFDSLEAVMRTF